MPLLRAGVSIVLKWRMEPVKKMPSEEFTMKNIVLIGMRGKGVICNSKTCRTGRLIRDQRREVT